jgi:hypothetical protein
MFISLSSDMSYPDYVHRLARHYKLGLEREKTANEAKAKKADEELKEAYRQREIARGNFKQTEFYAGRQELRAEAAEKELEKAKAEVTRLQAHTRELVVKLRDARERDARTFHKLIGKAIELKKVQEELGEARSDAAKLPMARSSRDKVLTMLEEGQLTSEAFRKLLNRLHIAGWRTRFECVSCGKGAGDIMQSCCPRYYEGFKAALAGLPLEDEKAKKEKAEQERYAEFRRVFGTPGHWPDCDLYRGGTECDMGPDCGKPPSESGAV